MFLNNNSLQQLSKANRLFLGFSGGLDSSVLLHLLASYSEYRHKITAIHVNHGLSANALAWEKHCQHICQQSGIPLIVKKIVIAACGNVEEEARKARYSCFRSFLNAGDSLILGHHRDDQAETVLLHLFRGAGIDGLSAMVPDKKFAESRLLRPLLHCSRKMLEVYARHHQLNWINDESNSDRAYSRNFLRHELIPLLQTRWPGVVTNLVRTATHCQNAQYLLKDLADIDYPTRKEPVNTLSLAGIYGLSHKRINNVLRDWFKKNAILVPDTATFNRLIPEVIFADPDANPKLEWGAWCLRRYRQTLYLLPKQGQRPAEPMIWTDFPLPFQLDASQEQLVAETSGEGLFIPEGTRLEIRFRKGGEQLQWRGQTKSLKKLFQEWNIPPWLREQIPLLYVNAQLAAVVGYAISDDFYKSGAGETWQILSRM